MAGIWISIAAKIVEYLVEPILNQFDYLINFNDNVEDLTKQVKKLETIKLKVKQLIEIARRNAEDIKLDVERWLSNVDEIIQCPKIKDLSLELTDLQKMDELHACQTLSFLPMGLKRNL